MSIFFFSTYNPGSIITKIWWDGQQARKLKIFIRGSASPPLPSKLQDETNQGSQCFSLKFVTANSLVGKVLSTKQINEEAFRIALLLCYKFGKSGSVTIQSLRNNKFIFMFSSEMDHRCVLLLITRTKTEYDDPIFDWCQQIHIWNLGLLLLIVNANAEQSCDFEGHFAPYLNSLLFWGKNYAFLINKYATSMDYPF